MGTGWGAAGHLRLAQGTCGKNPVTGLGWGRGCPQAGDLVDLTISPSADHSPWCPFCPLATPLTLQLTMSSGFPDSPNPGEESYGQTLTHSRAHDTFRAPEKCFNHFFNQKGKNGYNPAWNVFVIILTQLQKRVFNIFWRKRPTKVIRRPWSWGTLRGLGPCWGLTVW